MFTALRNALPKGSTLPPEAWRRRHRALLGVLGLHAIALPLYAAVMGYGPGHSLLHAAPLVAALLAGMYTRDRRLAACAVAVGLLTASALGVHTSGGLIEAHFHFFVMLILLSLYEDWVPFLLAIGYVVVHHGVAGVLDSHGVYDHAAAVQHPWKWAAIHGAFVLAASAGSVASWRLNEDIRAEAVNARDLARASEERFRRSFDDAPIGMSICDATGTWIQVNRSLAEMLGYSPEELVGRRFAELTHPDDRAAGREDLKALVEGRTRTLRREKRYLHADGHVIRVALGVSCLGGAEGDAPHFIAQMEDVTRRHEAERRARRRALQQTELAALSELALGGGDVNDVLRESVAATARSLDIPLYQALDAFPSLEALCDSAPGSCGNAVVGLASPETKADDLHFLGAVGAIVDGVIERDRHEAALRHQSLHDPLTGLPNRTLFLDRLTHALLRSQRSGRPLAVIFLDLDEFKVINDSLGHEAGDLLLQGLAPRLAAELRTQDTLARFGGDEFVMLCEDLASPVEALALADRLRDVFSQPCKMGEHEHFVSCSMGVAMSSPAYWGRPSALIRDADAAMYRAKTGGRDRFLLFDDPMRENIVQRLQTENGLRQALANDELCLSFQPLIDFESGRVAHCETLLRWDRPGSGLVPPDQFIPIAEKTGLIIPIGAWVLQEACRQAAHWHATADHPDLADMTVAVNISAVQIAQPGLPTVVAEALDQSGLRPDRLILEITETALIEDPDGAADTLRALRALGVGIALDDFGTGYSSLSSIKRYPLTAIKLDRSFVAELCEEGADAAIIASVVAMAQALSLVTVAEGVETAEQRDHLRDIGCDVGQGYFFSRPVSAAQFEMQVALMSAV